METFLYLKAIHIVFIVTWFAGLFYMPRLLIYLTEACVKPEPERSILTSQLSIMASRLWFGITWPSALITLAMGISLVVYQPAFLQEIYMQIKLTLVLLLYCYHASLHVIFKNIRRGIYKFTSQQLRLWNEVATLFLISIVFLIVLKRSLSAVWGITGLVIVSLLITLGIKLYKKYRN
jgi:protoporphyrinogen IX oxidase